LPETLLPARMLAEKLSMSYDEVERWIVNLVKNVKMDAKIYSTLVTGSWELTTQMCK